jgi:uncharacterized protein
METSIFWAGIEYNSLENCSVKLTDTGTDVRSTIVGEYRGNIYTIAYHLTTNEKWETTLLEIESRVNDQIKHQIFEGDGRGNWIVDGKQQPVFNNCIDIDLSLSPFTNTLPINRLKLETGTPCQILVIYFDLLGNAVNPMFQKYTRLSADKFKYESVGDDFESEISVDEFGFVIDYPQLFVRRRSFRSKHN